MRSMGKAIEQYERMLNKHGIGAFSASDIQQLHDLALEMNKSGCESSTILDAIYASLKAGFAIGYRTARRQKKRGE